LYALSKKLWRYTQEKTKPNAQRLRDFVDPALPAVEQNLFGALPITASQEIAVLASYFASLEATFGASDPS
jgi:hypothetical protein